MGQPLEKLLRRTREELRALGSDGGGYTDFFITENINAAIATLSEVYSIRDTIEIITTAVNEYPLPATINIENIIRAKYDGNELDNITLEEYFNTADPLAGSVTKWLWWKERIILLGAIATGKILELWVTRNANKLIEKHDKLELPSSTEQALVQYALSACYRSSKNYDRANHHFQLFLWEKNDLLGRGVSQNQRKISLKVQEVYSQPLKS